MLPKGDLRLSPGDKAEVFADIWLEAELSDFTIGAPEVHLLWTNNTGAPVGITIDPFRSPQFVDERIAIKDVANKCRLTRRFRPIGWNRGIPDEDNFSLIDLPAHNWRVGYVLADRLLKPEKCQMSFTAHLIRNPGAGSRTVTIALTDPRKVASVDTGETDASLLSDLRLFAYVTAPYIRDPRIRKLNILLRNPTHHDISISIGADVPNCPAIDWMRGDDMDWVSELTSQRQPRDIAAGGWAVFSVHLKGSVDPPQSTAGCTARVVITQHGVTGRADASKSVEIPVELE